MAKRKLLKPIAFILIFMTVSSSIYFLSLPDVAKLKKENPEKTSFMKYREKEWKEKGKKYRIKQIWVPLSRVSPFLIKAVLIAEDDRFWRHEGFDYEAIQKALEKDIKARKFKLGGSTISQQLAKNLYLSPTKNPLRKMREAVITWRLERVLSKRRILELYLNVAEWGEGVFGIEAASRHYYEKPSSELGPEEATRLAAILPNPMKYNPLRDQRYVVKRSNLIYSIMIKRGIIVPEYEEVTEDNNKASPERETEPALSPNPL
ncbi:MAG: monofunctional biosynthetic peptidoglycan transglycosylase [Nitrospirota bacterium]